MSINVGDVSGCLVVIGDYRDTITDIEKISRKMAETKWNESPQLTIWGYSYDFKSYYNLNKKEAEAYDNKAAMPESFVAKYVKKDDYGYLLNESTGFLYHKRKPDAFYKIKDAFRKHQLYRVKCSICNRIFFMDEYNFNCTKWRSCIGAECLENTISEESKDYSNSEYVWSTDSATLQVLDRQLEKVEELSNALTYYGLPNSEGSLKIAYISDIHLMHHLKYYDEKEDRMINDIVSKLYNTKGQADIIVFGGDISSDTRLTMKFYNAFNKRHDYEKYLVFKQEVSSMKRQKKYYEDKKSRLLNKPDKLKARITCEKEKLNKYFDYSKFEKYHDTYHPDLDYISTFDCYKKVKSYKCLMLSDKVEKMILDMARLYDYEKRCKAQLESYKDDYESFAMGVKEIERLSGKSVDEINITDYRQHIMLSAVKDIYVVLGNHEYIGFDDVASCVSYYKSELSKIGIKLLHNSSRVYNKFVIYGGTGFAKYDEKWNADTLICCPNFSRSDEKNETELFENGYKKALSFAKKNSLCFISVSHYPISACLNNKYDKEAIYFTGHNHQNKYVKNADRVLYADNQIGYKDNNIVFRIATTGFELNPYADMQDGLYVTTIKDYLQFYRYIGEDIGKGNALYERCQNGKASLYVVKRKGYYGFFILNPKGSAKGISIVNGGVTKRLTDSTDMNWICENFDVVLSKYLHVLTPLRNAQEQLSRELKELGLSGAIHGCIVDIDFYHHIMLNPADGSMTFYFSSEFGQVLNLDSFDDVIKSLERHNSVDFLLDVESIKRKYIEKSKEKNCLLSVTSNSYLLEAENAELVDLSEREEQIVSRTDGMYGVSRKVNPLQRLFSGHVLRDYDLRLTETKQKSYRKYLYKNRILSYEGIIYKIIEDEGGDIIVAEEVQEMDYNDGRVGEVTLTGKTIVFTISALRTKIADKKAYDTYWISTR